MADLITKSVLSVYATVESNLANLAVKDGQLIFVQDKHKIALDFGGKRTIYNQIQELATEGSRISMLAPLSGAYYFVLETSVLWTYRNGWVQITTSPLSIEQDLNAAVNAALEEAKKNGEFDGENGFSPIATVTQTATGATINITDKNGTTTATIANGKDTKEYSAWESIQFEVVVGAALSTGRYENPLSTAKYAEVHVGGYTQLNVTGWQFGASYGYALCAFYNEKQELISAVKLTDSTQYTDYLVDVPANAFTVVVNGLVGNAMALTGLKVFDCKVLAEEKANRIAKWVTPAISIKQGYIIAQSGTEEQANGNGEIGVVDVSTYKKVIVTGWQYGISYGFKLCYFYGADGQVLSSHQGSTESKKNVLTLDVPNGAVTLKVNGHRYEGNVSVSAYEFFDVADLYDALRPSGKKLITLGDSITALGTGDTGWLKYFIEKTNCELVANVAVNGAWLMDKAGTTYDGNPVFNGPDNNVNNVLGNQVQKILNNNYSAPDIIIIAIGTNAGISITKEQMKGAYYDSSNSLIPLDGVDRTTSAGAYRWCLEKLHTLYPNALIFWCTPIHAAQNIRTTEGTTSNAESLRIATEYTGQIMIDTIRCGINGVNEIGGENGEFLVDGLHPNANGAKKIGYYNASKVLPYLGNLC